MATFCFVPPKHRRISQSLEKKMVKQLDSGHHIINALDALTSPSETISKAISNKNVDTLTIPFFTNG